MRDRRERESSRSPSAAPAGRPGSPFRSPSPPAPMTTPPSSCFLPFSISLIRPSYHFGLCLICSPHMFPVLPPPFPVLSSLNLLHSALPPSLASWLLFYAPFLNLLSCSFFRASPPLSWVHHRPLFLPFHYFLS